MSILAGVFLGAFCAHGYMGLTLPQEEPVEIEVQQRFLTTDSVNTMPIKTIAEKTHKEYREQEEHVEQGLPEKQDAPLEQVKQVKQEKKDAPVESNVPAVPLQHRNKELTNYNIMFFGIEDNKLQMLTVYSINQENNWKSGTVFIPTDTLVPGTKNTSMADYFYQNGPEKVKKLVEKFMEININYYIMVDRNLLLEVEPYLDPIFVDGKKVNISQLFTKEITPEDEIILAELLKSFTKPAVYFGILPKLVLTSKQYIKTDFQLNWTSFWVHYQMAKNIDTSSVTKKIISGKYVTLRNQKYWIPTQHAWWNMVYEVTK
ncbi:MAG: hypothetical protein ACOX47_09420 [Bacillota bacterium]